MEKQMYILKWINRKGDEIRMTHQYKEDVYKFGEVLLSEGREITVCQMD